MRALVVVMLLVAAPAHAAPKYAHGYFAEAGVGSALFLADAGKYIAAGPSFALRSGYDLFSWLSLGGRLRGSIHEGDVPPPPDQEYLQFLDVGAEARITLRLGRVALFGEGGLGFGHVTTNLLDQVGITEPDGYNSVSFGGGGGIDYHTQNRHFSFGLAADYAVYPDFDGAQSVTVRLYLRYAK
jgi:hypothetical protein